jgi:Domain of unknown function (DUF4314)
MRGDEMLYQDFRTGDRVELVRTNDPFTRLVPGDQGTITGISLGLGSVGDEIRVRWDSGSSLTMLPDAGDEIRQV